jgi:hypothetical protein
VLNELSTGTTLQFLYSITGILIVPVVNKLAMIFQIGLIFSYYISCVYRNWKIRMKAEYIDPCLCT